MRQRYAVTFICDFSRLYVGKFNYDFIVPEYELSEVKPMRLMEAVAFAEKLNGTRPFARGSAKVIKVPKLRYRERRPNFETRAQMHAGR